MNYQDKNVTEAVQKRRRTVSADTPKKTGQIRAEDIGDHELAMGFKRFFMPESRGTGMHKQSDLKEKVNVGGPWTRTYGPFLSMKR